MTTSRAEHRAAADRCYSAAFDALNVLHATVIDPENPITDSDVATAVNTALVSAIQGLTQSMLALSANG